MKIVVIGGGFAGIAAARKIHNQLPFDSEHEVILIDRHTFTTMLPSLPDVAGQRVPPKSLIEDIRKQIPGGIRFINRTVDRVDFTSRQVIMGDQSMTYDYLVFSPGSKTNFFNKSPEFQKNLKLDCLEDAMTVMAAFTRAIQEAENLNVVISGAGFTGLELATNLYHNAKEVGKPINIYVVEKAPTVLPMLGETMARYVMNQMKRLKLNFLTDEEVVDYANGTVTLKNGQPITNAFFVWCSGVKLAVPVTGNQKQLFDGRIIVDEYLRIPEHPEVFVAGDSAAFKSGANYLRRAVNFAYMAGQLAGGNVLALLEDKPLTPFKPVDLGWVIPLYVTSIGEAFGHKTKGRLGIPLHYIMCGIKNYNVKNIISYITFAIRFVFAQPR